MQSKTAKKEKDKKVADDEFFIGGWDPYVVEITKSIRKSREAPTNRRASDRRRG